MGTQAALPSKIQIKVTRLSSQDGAEFAEVMEPQATATAAKTTAKPKKKLIRRTGVDRSQLCRRSFQGAFLLLNVALGTKFYFWVRQFERGAVNESLTRPAGRETARIARNRGCPGSC